MILKQDDVMRLEEMQKVEEEEKKKKMHKLTKNAVRGIPLEGLSDGEKALVAFYAYEHITQVWSYELSETEKLVSEELNAKMKDPTYAFEYNLDSKKDLILLYKINTMCDALKIMRPYIDRYWKLLDDNKKEMMEKNAKETTYIMGYRVSLRLLLDRQQEFQNELQQDIETKFRWPEEQKAEAKAMAGDTPIANMKRYLKNVDMALGFEKVI